MFEFATNSQCKVIVPVRDIAEVLASFEQLWRKSTGSTQWAFEQSDYFKSQTVEGRCDIWASQGQPIGLAYNRVKDALSRGFAGRLFFVEFDDLTAQPAQTMHQIYEFLGEQPFDHDYINVEQVTREDDVNVHKIPGLHTIRPTVTPVPKKAAEILGPVLAKKYANLEMWRAD